MLPFSESKGLARLGTYVYKTSDEASRYGYPDFYDKCLEEYRDRNNTTENTYVSSNISCVNVADEKGLLSSFSTSVYALVNKEFYVEKEVKNWEIVLKIKFPPIVGTYAIIGSGAGGQKYGLTIRANTSNKLILYVSGNGTSWNIANNIISGNSFELDKEYLLRVTYSLTGVEEDQIATYNVDLSENIENPNYVNFITKSVTAIKSTTAENTYKIFHFVPSLGIDASVTFPDGKIDLNKSYIKIDNEIFWKGVNTIPIVKNINGHCFYNCTIKDTVKDVILPYFTSNNQKGYEIKDALGSTTLLQRMFNRDVTPSDDVNLGPWATYWIEIMYPKEVVLSSYNIKADMLYDGVEYPTSWEVWGYNESIDEIEEPQEGVDYTLLDTISDGEAFYFGEEKEFPVETTEQFRYFRIVFRAGIVDSGNNGKLSGIHFNAKEEISTGCKNKIDEIYENTGIAWFYGIDEAEERILLPRKNERYLVEKKEATDVSADSTWYNLYSDGWLEQGGSLLPSYGNWQTTIIAFPKPFKDINYHVSLTSSWSSEAAASYINNYANKKVNQVTCSFLSYNDPGEGLGSWKASGYANIPAQHKSYEYIVVGNVPIKGYVGEYTEVAETENDTLPLFTGMYFDFKPNHVSWLKAGTEVSGEMYQSTYNELIKCLNSVDNKYNLKVINNTEKDDHTDYSEYWIVNENEQTFRTPLKTSLLNTISNARILIEKKEPTGEDSTWYNLYSDGWLEQGGIEKTAEANYVRGTVTFPKPYKDINYTAKITQSYTSTTGDGPAISNKTTQTMTWFAYNSIGLANWQTEGYAEHPSVEQIANSESTSLYFKIGNAVQSVELINCGEVLEELNLAIKKVECKSYVTETYKNGTSGYRVWSDGYCEQWGRLAVSVDSIYTITLLKEMRDTNYLCLNSRGVEGYYSASNYGRHDDEPFNFTTTSFDVYGHFAVGLNVIQWKVTGYMKEGTY